MANSILKNTLAKGTLNIFNMIIPLLIVPYIYRVLNPETIGTIEYATTLYSYFGYIGALGIYNFGIRELSRVRNSTSRSQDIFKNLFVIGLISNILIFIAYLLLVTFFCSDANLKLIMYILGLSLLSQAIAIEWVNEAFEDYRFITVKTIFIRTLNLLLIFFFVVNVDDYIKYVWILTAYGFLNYAVSYVYAQKYIKISFRTIFSGLHLRTYIKPLLLIMVLNNTIMLYTAVDRTMLGIYCGAEDVAYYSIGQKVMEIINLLLLSVVYVMIPRLSYYLETDKEKYLENVRKLIRIVLMLVLPISIGMFMLSKYIILLFAGEQYLGAIDSFRMFSFRIIIAAIQVVLYNQIIFLHRKEKILVILNFICIGLNIILNYLCLDLFSPAIAITTTIFSEIVFLFLCFFYIKRHLHIDVGLFGMDNLKYILISVLFIPVIILLSSFITDNVLLVITSLVTCSILYIVALRLCKDELFCYFWGRFINLVKHKTDL